MAHTAGDGRMMFAGGQSSARRVLPWTLVEQWVGGLAGVVTAGRFSWHGVASS
jgi:hypothetical protein